jgi:HEPN domain-containing protein
LPNQTVFHAQQAAEKAIKAVLLEHKIRFPRTHDLGELIVLIQQHAIMWPFAPDEVEALRGCLKSPEISTLTVRA